MSQRMRRNERQERIADDVQDRRGESRNLSEMRSQGESLLAAAEDAINSALSGDSEAFLSQSRQRGGQ